MEKGRVYLEVFICYWLYLFSFDFWNLLGKLDFNVEVVIFKVVVIVGVG